MKKIILRCANGLGNQMFLYAFAFALSKKLNRTLYIDTKSSFNKKMNFKNKRKMKYELDIFNLSAFKANEKYCFNTFLKKIKRKFLKNFDYLRNKKNFLIENKNQTDPKIYNKIIKNIKFNDILYIEGYFQSSNYFSNYRNELINEFKFKKKIKTISNYKKKIISTNSVSLAIRSDRFNEQIGDENNKKKIYKSLKFERDQINYIERAIKFYKKKLKKPFFFLFSDSPDKYKITFKKEKNFIIINKYNKVKALEDYYLMSLCKHFAVAPTTFHYWPAWLSNYEKKICIRPKSLNPSNNKSYWPSEWQAI